MHIGPFDEEPRTVKLIEKYMEENNLTNDINKERGIMKYIYLILEK
jgi:hypothetical protein